LPKRFLDALRAQKQRRSQRLSNAGTQYNTYPQTWPSQKPRLF